MRKISVVFLPRSGLFAVEMTLKLPWKCSCSVIFFVIILSQISGSFSNPDDIYKYVVLPETDHHLLLLIKRSVLESQLQVAPPMTSSSVTPTSEEPLETTHLDKDVKDSPLLSNSTAKTGGNYLTTNNTNLDESKKNTTSKGSKLLENLQGLHKNVSLMQSDIGTKLLQVNSSIVLSSTSTVAAPTERVNETSKAETSKTPKKAESITKPPKPDPTKPVISEDKTPKKSATATSEDGSKALVIPTGSTESTSTTEHSEPDIQIAFPQDISNSTLREHAIFKLEEDHHQYYNSSFVVNNEDYGHAHWVDMTNRSDVQVNELLSQSHRRAATVKLTFDFPFYGHLVRKVTIATGGFLYTGDYVHSWLAATQYIAPLMANFDTSISNHSFVKYIDNGTAFTVQWEKVVLQDKPDSGDFTFQATLHSNGDIVFVYRNVPVIIESIEDDHHPVKVGVSDAYIIDRNVFFVRRKTIYEYHRVNFDRQDIKNWTVIYLNALPTCVDVKDCNECLSRATSFQCHWCPSSNRCSNGMDRFRQEWLSKGCDRTGISNISFCPTSQGTNTDLVSSQSEEPVNQSQAFSDKHSSTQQEVAKSSMGVSGIVGVLFLTAVFSGFAIWVFYAYRNPHTASGQFLIKYRPSTWSWRRGEARYTAATIHM